MLTDVLAAEFGPHGVRVNGVAPGVTMTENMKRRVAAGERDPEKIVEWNAIPEIVLPEDVAESIFFLCSDEAHAISGVTLPIDYGWQGSRHVQWLSQVRGLPKVMMLSKVVKTPVVMQISRAIDAPGVATNLVLKRRESRHA